MQRPLDAARSPRSCRRRRCRRCRSPARRATAPPSCCAPTWAARLATTAVPCSRTPLRGARRRGRRPARSTCCWSSPTACRRRPSSATPCRCWRRSVRMAPAGLAHRRRWSSPRRRAWRSATRSATLLGAALVAMLIGERPGLSSPDSLGIYLTWQPRPGRSDAERNCISNIRPEGLGYDAAARRLWWLCGQARQLRLTGVQLKDRQRRRRRLAGCGAGAEMAEPPADGERREPDQPDPPRSLQPPAGSHEPMPGRSIPAAAATAPLRTSAIACSHVGMKVAIIVQVRHFGAQQPPHRLQRRARLQRRMEVAALGGAQQLDADDAGDVLRPSATAGAPRARPSTRGPPGWRTSGSSRRWPDARAACSPIPARPPSPGGS